MSTTSAEAPTFLTLPCELRLVIYSLAFPSETVKSLKNLGFRNPHIEAPSPNVVITLPAAALTELFNSNPAGDSKGRFWKPHSILAVCQQTRQEAGEVFGKIPVITGTWMSFLSNRPVPLLARITHVEFKYWITARWNPLLAPGPPGHPRSLESSVISIVETWSENLERLSALMPNEHLPKLSVDLSLIHPTVYTYRLRAGLSKDMLKYLKERLPVVMEEVLTKFQTDGGWPVQGLIVDGTEDYSNRPAMPVQAAATQVAAVA